MSKILLLNDRYQLDTRLGSGGMAVVFKARDLMLERDVAIKTLRKDYSSNPDFRESFRQEAKAAANLSHPNIVTVHDFGFDKEVLFIVMEYISGNTLKMFINQRGRLSPETAISILVKACAGIGYAHRAGFLHCDVKPQNILVTRDQRVKVTDFGIARALDSIREDEQASIVWGSPQYFSPEQAAGKAPSPSSDVYSLGVILFEMLTGQLPFSGNTSKELVKQHLDSNPPEPKFLNPAIDDDLNRIILKVLSKEASARYRTADQLGRVLITFSEKNVSGQLPQPVSTRNHEPKPGPVPSATSEKRNNSKVVPNKPKSTVPSSFDLDWITIGLGFIALLFIGGLIPFWVWVYFSLLGR